MTALKPLIEEIERICKLEFGGAGFRHKRGIFLKDINEETIGRIGLPRSTYRAEQTVDIYPAVGVFNIPIERLVHEWAGWDNIRYTSPTVSRPLEYLMPERERRNWYFTPEGDTLETVRDIVAAVVKYGVPWIQALTDRQKLLESLQGEGCLFPEYRYYLMPAAYYVWGKREKAKEYARKTLDKLVNDPNPYVREQAKEYAAFVQRL